VPEKETKIIENEKGQKLGEAEYFNGKLHGINKIWSQNGSLTQLINYQNGELHGTYETWWENGNKKEVGQFFNGERIGMYRWYTQEGELWKEHTYSEVKGN